MTPSFQYHTISKDKKQIFRKIYLNYKRNDIEIKNTSRNVQIYILSTVLALVQVLDIVIHVANSMIEPIRIASNVFIFIWLGIVVSGRFDLIVWHIAGGFVGVYLLLNIVFLATEGLTNPDNNDEFRTVLSVLVGVTQALSVWLTNRAANRTS